MFRRWLAVPRRWLVSLLHPPLTLLELAAIAFLWLLYLSLIVPASVIGPFNQLDVSPVLQAWTNPDYRQPGVEHERLAGVLVPVQIGLERYGHLPTWNPYLGDGEPTINNPFSYLFNPFYSLPLLFLGGVEGSKLAAALSLLIAGCSMWALARAIGVGGVGRVTAGALYMMSGGIAAKYYTGHFQLGLSLAWVPLVFAGLWWTLRSQDRRAPALMAAAFALLFTSGNIYYTLHTLICCLIIFAAHIVSHDGGHWRVQWQRARRAAIGGAFAVGLSALQFMPVLATSNFIIHSGDPEIITRYSLGQAVINLTYPWERWQPEFDDTPPLNMLVVVDYNSIGVAPFLLIGSAAAVLLLIRRSRTRQYNMIIGIALILTSLMMVWGAGQTAVVQALYANVDFLAQFRFVGRALAIAALWWIVLAAIAVDILWTAARKLPRVSSAFDAYGRARLLRAFALGMAVWGYFLAYSLAGNSARLSLAFYNYALVNRLDALRFASLLDASRALWLCLLAAMVMDTLLMAASQVLRWTQARVYGWRGLAVRAVHLVLLMGITAALLDIARVNSQLLPLTPLLSSFTPLYEYARSASPDTPFPEFQEVYSPFAFDAYYAEVRNWGLSEGWKPGAIPVILPKPAGGLSDLPRWAIVSNVYGGASLDIMERFVRDLAYQRRRCTALEPSSADPCDLGAARPYAAVLYEKPDVLPYAFVASGEVLTTDPAQLKRENVMPVPVISHQQDTITLRVEHPDARNLNSAPETDDYYLVVRETHFPGWQTLVDGLPVASTTVTTNQTVGQYEGFIGVRLLPGSLTYTLRFQPPGLAAGLVIFLLTLLAVIFYLFPHRPQHNKSQPDNSTGSHD